MTAPLDGAVALVTGASTGIGRATAIAYAQAGARVVLADLDIPALHTTTGQLRDSGHDVTAVICDVADEDQVKALIETTVQQCGQLDIAYNNAGIQPDGQPTDDVAMSTFDRVIAVNLRGVFACMKYELAQMRRQGSGVIVNCSSIGGVVGAPGQAAYHAARHGVLGLTKSAALEVADLGIRINAVSPGAVDTPLVDKVRQNNPDSYQQIMAAVPMKRIADAAEIARVVLWLSGPDSTYLTGTNLVIDGGLTVG